MVSNLPLPMEFMAKEKCLWHNKIKQNNIMSKQQPNGHFTQKKKKQLNGINS